MGRTPGGYTIAEVMIVLVVMGVLLFSVLTVVGGQQQKTSFTQAMQDIASTIQNYASQIQAGSYPGSEQYGCRVMGAPTPRATLINNPGVNDSNCLFLGRAFLVEPNSNIIHSFVVLGNRLDSSGQPSTSIDSANPEPARLLGSPLDSFNLIDSYTISAGATILDSNGAGNNWDLIGLYSQLEGNLNSGSGNQTLSLRSYPFPGQTYKYPDPQITSCIEEQIGPPDCSSPTTVNQWTLCMSDGSQTAALEVNANPSGLTTKVNFDPTIAECP